MSAGTRHMMIALFHPIGGVMTSRQTRRKVGRRKERGLVEEATEGGGLYTFSQDNERPEQAAAACSPAAAGASGWWRAIHLTLDVSGILYI